MKKTSVIVLLLLLAFMPCKGKNFVQVSNNHTKSCLNDEYALEILNNYPTKNDTSTLEWTFPNSEGVMVSLSDYKGMVVVLDFFYNLCEPCMQAIPVLQRLYEKYASQGLEVIGLNGVDQIESINELKEEKGFTYMVVCHDRSLLSIYNVKSFPTLCILNRDGEVVFTDAGYYEGMEERLDEILKGIVENQ